MRVILRHPPQGVQQQEELFHHLRFRFRQGAVLQMVHQVVRKVKHLRRKDKHTSVELLAHVPEFQNIIFRDIQKGIGIQRTVESVDKQLLFSGGDKHKGGILPPVTLSGGDTN